MFKHLAQTITTYPLAVVCIWLILFGLCIPFALQAGTVLSSTVDPPPQSEALTVDTLLQGMFADRNGFQIILVSDRLTSAPLPPAAPAPSPTDPAAPSPSEEPAPDLPNYDPALYEYFTLLDTLKTRPEIANILDFQTSPWQLWTPSGDYVAVLDLAASTWEEAQRLAQELHTFLATYTQDHPNLTWTHRLTAGAALENELIGISSQDARHAERYGLPISLLVLVLVFGSVMAASLPLIMAVIAIALALACLYFAGQMYLFASYVQIVISMLGLATGIDYALLIVNRFREELRNHTQLTGRDRAQTAAALTTQTAGRAIVSSGLTVVVALAALLIPPSQFIRSIGIGGMIVVLCSVSVSVTLLPAILTLLGPRVNLLALSKRALGQRSRAMWGHWADMVLRRPWLWALLGLSLLIALSWPALQMRLGISSTNAITENTEARQAYAVLESAELDSLVSAIDIIVDFGERGFYHPASVRDISQLTRLVQRDENVSQVFSATSAAGLPMLFVQQYYARQDVAETSPLADLVKATVSIDGRYAFVQVFPKRGLPSEVYVQMMAELRAFEQAENITMYLGGGYVTDIDWRKAIYDAFPIAVIFVYFSTFVLLMIIFRSLLIPLKAILLNTLTVTAAFGMITLVFQQGFGAHLFGIGSGLGYVEASVPIFIFAMVFGISMDYEVFLVARIFEGHHSGMTNREAVRYALSRTGSVITSAALIMLIVFGVFLGSRIVLIKSLSLGLFVAVLLDATVVRLMLVPVTMILAGKWNWWLPPWLAKPLEKLKIHLEG